MIPNVEDVDEVIVGRYYMVPTITKRGGILGMSAHPQVVPVIGPLHEDMEIIRFKDRHWHPDRRFVLDSFFDDWFDETHHWGTVYTPCPTHTNGDGKTLAVPKHEWPLWIESGLRKMKCKRLVDSFMRNPERGDCGVPYLPALEKKYESDQLRKMICPHRGISCVGVKPEADGGVVCPGHGLKWNPDTGELISRTGQDFRQKSLLSKLPSAKATTA